MIDWKSPTWGKEDVVHESETGSWMGESQPVKQGGKA